MSAEALDGSALGRVQQGVGRFELARLVRRALDQDPARRAERLERPGELPAARLQLRAARRRPRLLHAGRAVEQDDRRVGAAARGQAQPAPGQRPADGEDQAGDRQHAERHDQPLPEPGVAARHPVRRQQEHHRRPVDRLVPPLIDQVDDDRQGDERQGRQEHRLEEAHRTPLRPRPADQEPHRAPARNPRRCVTRW